MSVSRLALTVGVAFGALAGTALRAEAQAHAGHGAAHPAPAAPAAPAWSDELARHFEGIALTDALKARIAALQRDHHARMDRLRDSARAAGAPTAGNAALDAKVEAVRSAEHAAFKTLLDEADRKRFDANMARMHGAGHGTGHGTGHGAGHGAGHGTSTGRPPRA